MGYTLLPTQTRIPIPRPPLPVDRFPSFIVITSPSVIVTTLNFTTGLIEKSIAQSEKSIGLTDFTTALTGCGKKLQAGNPSCSGGL